MTENYEVFIKELMMIGDLKIRDMTINLLKKVPDYYYHVAASSTAKYHSETCLGEGGLVRHVKACCMIANELFNLEMFKGLLPKKDLVISALLLHDCIKHHIPKREFTVSEHPRLAAEFIIKEYPENEIALEISQLVLRHSGQWDYDSKTKEIILPRPETKLQNFVHLIDYLGSRRFFKFILD